MRLSHAWSRSISRLLIGVLLFAQLAVAGHACPSMAPAHGPAMVLADESAAAHPCCDPAGADASALCAAHCHAGQQNADTASSLPVVQGLPVALYTLRPEPRLTPPGAGGPSPAAGACQVLSPEPPHALLHCVFRT